MANRLLLDAFLETLWPTRCACCDAPGLILCERCEAALEYLDRWKACPRCGAPWGIIQCDRCGHESNQDASPPLCVSALRHRGRAAVLVKTYKDKGEQRLAPTLARLMANAIPPSWRIWAESVTFVPATSAARRKRGFDHMEMIAKELANQLGLSSSPSLEPPRSLDQRALSRAGRLENMAGRFSADRHAVPRRVILIDDVMTTGATLSEAKKALEEHEYEVRLASVTRV